MSDTSETGKKTYNDAVETDTKPASDASAADMDTKLSDTVDTDAKPDSDPGETDIKTETADTEKSSDAEGMAGAESKEETATKPVNETVEADTATETTQPIIAAVKKETKPVTAAAIAKPGTKTYKDANVAWAKAINKKDESKASDYAHLFERPHDEKEKEPEEESYFYHDEQPDNAEQEQFSAEPAESEAAPVTEPKEQPKKPVEQPESAWGKFFNGCAAIGPFILLLILCGLVWPEFMQPQNDLYCPAEASKITVLLNCINQGAWLAPVGLENGAFTAAQWPVFYWLAGLLGSIPGVMAYQLLLPLMALVCAALAVLGVWAFTLSARFGMRAAFAAGLILICAPFFAPMPHFVGPAGLSSALMLFALCCFYRGWSAKRAWLSLPAAFVLTGLAGLSGGIFFLAVPLIASFFYLIWTGSFRRAQALDALAGFILLLALLGAWFGELVAKGYDTVYLTNLFATNPYYTWPPQAGWWIVFVMAVGGILPWILMIFGVSWFRVLGHMGKTLGDSRHVNGSAMMWISLVVAGLMAPLYAGTDVLPVTHALAIALLCLLAPLLGKAFVHLSPTGNRFFFFLFALLLCLIGLLLLALSYDATQEFIFGLLPFTPKLPIAPNENVGALLLSLEAFPYVGGILLAGGLYAFTFTRRCKKGGGLIYAAILLLILCQPILLRLVPELSATKETRLVTLPQIQQQILDARAIKAPAQIEQSEQPAVKVMEPAPESAQPADPLEPAVVEPDKQ